ncbi:hypothetical protein VTI28DRAFT_4648 [Corynascus sepedonium]
MNGWQAALVIGSYKVYTSADSSLQQVVFELLKFAEANPCSGLPANKHLRNAGTALCCSCSCPAQRKPHQHRFIAPRQPTPTDSRGPLCRRRFNPPGSGTTAIRREKKFLAKKKLECGVDGYVAATNIQAELGRADGRQVRLPPRAPLSDRCRPHSPAPPAGSTFKPPHLGTAGQIGSSASKPRKPAEHRAHDLEYFTRCRFQLCLSAPWVNVGSLRPGGDVNLVGLSAGLRVAEPSHW